MSDFKKIADIKKMTDTQFFDFLTSPNYLDGVQELKCRLAERQLLLKLAEAMDEMTWRLGLGVKSAYDDWLAFKQQEGRE